MIRERRALPAWLWDAYAATAIDLVDPPVRLAGPGAAARVPVALPAIVATAWNPMSQPAAETDNAHRQHRLRAALQASGWTLHEAHAGALDGTWSEDSLVVPGMGPAEGVALGRSWQQAGVFAVSHERVEVLDCADGSVRRTVPRIR